MLTNLGGAQDNVTQINNFVTHLKQHNQTLVLHTNPMKCPPPYASSFSPLSLFRMMLANYLGRKGQKTCLKGVVVFSAGWDVFECTASLEKPLDRFLFNSYLTSCLQASVHRSAKARLTWPLAHC